MRLPVLSIVTALVLATATARGVEPIAGHPDSTLDCAGLVGVCVDLEATTEGLYLLDAEDRVLLLLDRQGRLLDELQPMGSAGFEQPAAIARGCAGRIFVTEQRACLYHEYDPAAGTWLSHELPHRVQELGADDHHLVRNGHRVDAPHLLEVGACDADSYRTIGTSFARYPGIDPAATNALNWARLDVSDGLIVAGHVALGHVQVFTVGGDSLAAFSLAGSAPQEVRRFFWGKRTPALLPLTRTDLAATIADVESAAGGSVAVYIEAMQVFADRIYLLVASNLHVYDMSGRLVAVHDLSDGDDQMVCNVFSIADDGTLYTMDTRFLERIYLFEGFVAVD